MRLILLTGLLLINQIFVIGQESKKQNVNQVYIPSISNIQSFGKLAIPAQNDLIKFLETKYLSNLENQSFLLEYEKISPLGKHYKFNHYYKNYPVYQSFVQVHQKPNGEIIMINDAVVSIINKPEFQEGFEQNCWISTEKGLISAKNLLEWDAQENAYMNRVYIAPNQRIISESTRLNFSGPDSMITAMVYLPNPIVKANANYGGGFVDNNDKNSADLENTRSRVRMPLVFDNGKFILKQGKLTVKDIHPPSIPPVQPMDTFLNYTRDQSGFEDINALYHLYVYSEYLKRTGFEVLLDSINIDTHGESGADNSFFDPSKYPYVLEYGTGCVDDAEDGQVVIHEFAHSLSTIAAKGTASGYERSCMEEGQADYFAMSYSHSLSQNKKHLVFSWDAHNECWDGFSTNSPRTYLQLSGIKDEDRQIWATALMCFNEKIGRNKADSILHSFLFLQSKETSMPQMARAILKVDSLLFKGQNVANIWQCFTDRRILDTVPWELISAKSLEKDIDYRVLNSSGFAAGTSEATILLLNPGRWENIEIMDQTGKLIKKLEIAKEVILRPEEFTSGIYLLKLIAKGGDLVVPIKIGRW